MYYDLRNPNISQKDVEHMQQRLPWYDPPSLPHITTPLSPLQPGTSNEAMMRFNLNIETMSTISRAATWAQDGEVRLIWRTSKV